MTLSAEVFQGYRQNYGIEGRVAFEMQQNTGFVRLSGDGGEALVALQGAQVLSWRTAAAGEMLWWSPLSPVTAGAPTRGGIPLCWPWFGPHPTDPSRPMHGLIRTELWTVDAAWVEEGAACVSLALEAAGARVRLTAKAGARLSVTLETENVGTQPLTITEALHTYFAVADVGQIQVIGLDGCNYRDRTENDAVKAQRGALTIVAETNAHFDVTPDHLVLIDRGRGHSISIDRTGGASTVVWNPGASAAKMADVPPGGERQYLCVESGNIGLRAVTLAAGERHSIGATYTVAPR